MSNAHGARSPGLSMSRFQALYGSEEACEMAVAKARWPDGFRCRCGSDEATTFRRGNRGYWQCTLCRHQTTALAGTIFQSSKLPLTAWFLSMHLLTQAKNNLSALELQRHLGVSYRTAWAVKHKILEVMRDVEQRRQWDEVSSETMAQVGGARSRRRTVRGLRFQVRLHSDGNGRPGLVRLSTAKAVAIERRDGARKSETKRRSVKNGAQALANHVRSAMTTTYRSIDYGKYGGRYLAEAQFRLNRRFEPQSIFCELLSAASATTPCPEKVLRTLAESST